MSDAIDVVSMVMNTYPLKMCSYCSFRYGLRELD